MILNGVLLIGQSDPVNLLIRDGKIALISSRAIEGDDDLQITPENTIAFPGLINSHDHLDFNLFPQLGYNTYNNYTEWGPHIHQKYKNEIAAVLKIPAELRYRWGLFKNLLCGVTTVINHGEHSGFIDDLITVFENYHCLHSVGFEKNWRLKLNDPSKIKLPAVIHTGEGTDAAARQEIDQLISWNLLHKPIVGIHGVAMTVEQAKSFKALVWCPQSNFFLLDKTAPVNLLKKETTLLFGTDSTLTSTWNIWGHIRLAKTTGMLSDNELYHSLNRNAAKTWQLNTGEIAEGKDADIVIAKAKPGMAAMDSFYTLDPDDLLMVVHKGNIRLFDESLCEQLVDVRLSNYSKIQVNDTIKYVQVDLPALMEEILQYYPQADFPVTAFQLVDQPVA